MVELDMLIGRFVLNMILHLDRGETIDQRTILRRLSSMQYTRNDIDFRRTEHVKPIIKPSTTLEPAHNRIGRCAGNLPMVVISVIITTIL